MKRVIQRQITTIKIVSIQLTWADDGETPEASSDREIVSLAQHSFIHQYDPVPASPFELDSVILDSSTSVDDPDPDRN